MKKLFLTLILLFALILIPSLALAQGMMDNWASTSSLIASDDHTASEEVEGEAIWEKLQAKEVECQDLTNDNYAALGEYFMGQSIGDTQRHAVMNQMMTSMMGEKGEEQMHVVMGKRLSGCGVGFMPMMGYYGNNMMGGWNGFGLLGWLPMLIFWALLILGVVALIRYLARLGQTREDKTPLDILKERYARGEINKKEFEEKKRDLA